jgi:hypothetical protein
MNLRSLRTNSESVHCDCVEVACVMGNGSSTRARLIAVSALVSICVHHRDWSVSSCIVQNHGRESEQCGN